jgi:hypothetical protein
LTMTATLLTFISYKQKHWVFSTSEIHPGGVIFVTDKTAAFGIPEPHRHGQEGCGHRLQSRPAGHKCVVNYGSLLVRNVCSPALRDCQPGTWFVFDYSGGVYAGN